MANSCSPYAKEKVLQSNLRISMHTCLNPGNTASRVLPILCMVGCRLGMAIHSSVMPICCESCAGPGPSLARLLHSRRKAPPGLPCGLGCTATAACG